MTAEDPRGEEPGSQETGERVTAYGASHRGKVRSHNEDAFFIAPKLGAFVVADGMGGLQRGDVASRTVIKTVLDAIKRGLTIDEGFRLAHSRVHELTDVAANERMGSTAVAVGVAGMTAGVYWVGDSRAYLWRRGELRQLTRDHSYVQELIDLGVIEKSEAEVHPNRSVVTRAIGVRELDEIDVARVDVDLEPGDRLLLCTDGLSGFLKEDALREELANGGTDRELVTRLIDRTLADTDAGDNLTAVLVSVPD